MKEKVQKVLGHETKIILKNVLKRGKFNQTDIDHLREVLGIQSISEFLFTPVEIEVQEIAFEEIQTYEINIEELEIPIEDFKI